jgi:hypothetical protein
LEKEKEWYSSVIPKFDESVGKIKRKALDLQGLNLYLLSSSRSAWSRSLFGIRVSSRFESS